jgi:hypothetical protein
LEFQTTKTVRVKSPVLGLLYYTLYLAIALYIIVYVFYLQKHYLDIAVPKGIQRTAIEDPCIPATASDACSYPKLTGTAALNRPRGCYLPQAFRCAEHSYCSDSKTKPWQFGSVEGAKMPCAAWDGNSVVPDPGERGALTIATRALVKHQELLDLRTLNTTRTQCKDQRDMYCQWYPNVRQILPKAERGVYMSDIGNFTIDIAHSMWGAFHGKSIQANAQMMEGSLLKCKAGQSCDSNPDNWRSLHKLTKRVGDKITVKDLLYAATPANQKGVEGPGLELDRQSDACPEKCDGELSTYRFVGAILHIDLIYDNTGLIIKGSSSTNIKYEIKVFVKPKAVYNVEVVQRGAAATSMKRDVKQLSGIRIFFTVGGQLGEFKWNKALLQLSTSFAMFALATLVVDKAMIYVLPYIGLNMKKNGNEDLDYETAKYTDWPPKEDEETATASTGQPTEATSLLPPHP